METKTLAMWGVGDLRVAKLEVEWKWNKEKKKEHYILFLRNDEEFEDITPKPYSTGCCLLNEECEHEHTPLEENIKKFLGELRTTKHELEESFEWWSGTDDANELRTLLSKSEEKLRRFGLPESTGIECCSVSDVRKWYKNYPNKVAFKIYFKKSIDLHYEFYCKYRADGEFIEQTADKQDMCFCNICAIKNWLEKLK